VRDTFRKSKANPNKNNNESSEEEENENVSSFITEPIIVDINMKRSLT